MANYYISPERLITCLRDISKQSTVYVPVKTGEYYSFSTFDEHLIDGDENSEDLAGKILPGTDYVNTIKPPKDLFFPQYEMLLKYQKNKGERPVINEPDISKEKRVIFGIRPCDAASLELLDHVFIGQEYQDPYYQSRRSNTTIISLACQTQSEVCFCQNPMSARGADALLVRVADDYLVDIRTEKGREIFEDYLTIRNEESSSIFCPDYQEVVRQEDIAKLSGMFTSSIWEEIQEKCLNCGICTFLCPTCHCFDITDDKKGKIIRSWDSCMFSSFTKHGSGHNPRPTGKERIRQRIMHKFSYFPDKYGSVACVGCGRCVQKCPVNFDIREFLESIKGVKQP
ncbi:MAG: hypothetical protein APF84_18145 [Gracilibacter sp. BRH_c7a]|nr:MAG: hypothetical protein APF84_18145 [Gracilibacter sp. BRH_c7a]